MLGAAPKAVVVKTWLLVAILLPALVVACGGDATTSGIRIYDVKHTAATVVTSADVVRSSIHTFHHTQRNWSVSFALTKLGAQRFGTLTRALAQRGARLHHFQRFAFDVNGRTYARLYVDYRANPDGLVGSAGAEFQGLSRKVAQQLVREMREAASGRG